MATIAFWFSDHPRAISIAAAERLRDDLQAIRDERAADAHRLAERIDETIRAGGEPLNLTENESKILLRVIEQDAIDYGFDSELRDLEQALKGQRSEWSSPED